MGISGGSGGSDFSEINITPLTDVFLILFLIMVVIAPMITFILSLIGWAVVPFGPGVVLADINVGVLYILAISSLGVYGIIMAGWASNSKYAFLGAVRSSAHAASGRSLL